MVYSPTPNERARRCKCRRGSRRFRGGRRKRAVGLSVHFLSLERLHEAFVGLRHSATPLRLDVPRRPLPQAGRGKRLACFAVSLRDPGRPGGQDRSGARDASRVRNFISGNRGGARPRILGENFRTQFLFARFGLAQSQEIGAFGGC